MQGAILAGATSNRVYGVNPNMNNLEEGKVRANSQISVRHEGDIAIFDITGYLTDASASTLTAAYAETAVQSAEKLLLNFERRSFITSSGFGEIIRLLWQIRDKGQILRVAHPSNQVRNIFNTIGLSQSIGVFASEAAALEDF